jgi:hypothetical protein
MPNRNARLESNAYLSIHYEYILSQLSAEPESISPISSENARNSMSSCDKMFKQTWKKIDLLITGGTTKSQRLGYRSPYSD